MDGDRCNEEVDMPDEAGRYQNDPKLLDAIKDVLKSDDFTAHLANVIEGVLKKQGVEKRSYPKKHTCSRCYTPRNPCRPMVSVMMVPIPVFNPFWWADTCHPRACEPSMPECCHERPDPPPEPERPPTIK
jgi:hypothetical protein